MKTIKIALPLLVGLACSFSHAATSPSLGAAQNFAALSAATLTNTGPSKIHGDLGVWPGTAITGIGSIALSGTLHQGDSFARDAELAARNAYTLLAAEAPTSNLSGQDLGSLGTALTPGVYHFDSSAMLTGTLTLDALNNPNSVFIFQIVSSLTTASNAVVNVINGSADSGIFWQIGSSATLETGTFFAGNILADQSITMKTGAQIVCGRAFALEAAVTLDTNTISADCGAFDGASGRSDFGSFGFSGVSPVPEPSTSAMLLAGLALLGLVKRRKAMAAV